MLSIEQCRKVDPAIKDLPDEEVARLRDALYGFGQLAFEVWQSEKFGSKNPVRSLPIKTNKHKI